MSLPDTAFRIAWIRPRTKSEIYRSLSMAKLAEPGFLVNCLQDRRLENFQK